MTGTLRQMEVIDAIVQVVVSSQDDIAYLSGSLIEGFGNSASDIDLFLVTAEDPKYGGGIGSLLGDYYLDLELHRFDHMHDLVERLNALDPADFAQVWQTPLGDIDLYYRTLVGQACHNPEGFAALRASFSREVSKRLLAAWCGLRYRASIQQAWEELEAGHATRAALAAQAAAASALDSYLAKNGECFPSLKWRFEKLARLHGAASELYARAWKLIALGKQNAADYVSAVEALGNDLGMSAYGAWSLDDVPLKKRGDSRCFAVAEEQLIVQDSRFIYSADIAVTEALALIEGGTTRSTLVSELSRSGTSEGEVRDMLTSLQAAGLVRGY